jgi:uncharacterized protein (TIGR03083 family)
VDTQRLASEERADLAAFLATLSPEQWHAPTLCKQWDVRDAVTHVISHDELGLRGLPAAVARGRFRPARVNDTAIAGLSTRSPQQPLALLTRHLHPLKHCRLFCLPSS